MPWRNGGGVTHEVARSPGDGEFDWRVSFAEIGAGGPFSSFPGVDRHFVVVDGPALVLTVDGVDHPVSRHEPLAFAGESAVSATITGPTVDLNVMTRRGRCTATLAVAHLSGPLVLPYDGRLLVAVLDGEVQVTTPGEAVTATLLDVVLAPPAPVTVDGDGTVAVIRLLSGG